MEKGRMGGGREGRGGEAAGGGQQRKERGREGWRDGGSEGGGVAHREGSGGLPAVPGQDGETE